MKFSKEVWQAVEPVYTAILDHPFNKELCEGTLDKDVFRFYIQQDALYLFHFGKALSIIASKVDKAGHLAEYARFAEGAVVVEKALHGQYFEEFGVTDAEERSPTCSHYTSYLLATCSTEPVEVGMAALLPCFWIYKEVGDHIHAQAAPNNPYATWIDTYAGEEFAELVRKAIAITDEVAEEVSPKVWASMKEAFIRASKLEWMFWDSAYRLENWSV